MLPAEPETRRWQALYDTAPCGLLLTRDDGGILLANATILEWLGLDGGAMAGRRLQELLTTGGRIFHHTHLLPLLHLQGAVTEVQLDLLHADGRAIPMVLNLRRREREGVYEHEIAVFVATDRHAYERELRLARSRAEASLAQQRSAQQALALSDARLRMALEAAQMHVWEVDPASGERRYHPSVAALLGFDAPQPVSMAQFDAVVHPDDRAGLQEAFQPLLEGATRILRCDFRLAGVDGIERTVQATARAVHDAPEDVVHVIGLLQDISELTRQRAAAEDRALLAEQMMGIVSHDLRNPLSAITLGAHVLRQAPLAEPFPRALHHITQSAQRAKRMIEDLLDFTMARMGRGLSVAKRVIELHATVAAAVDELRQSYPDRVLQHRASGANGSVAADNDRLFQLLGNLIGNAMTYGDPTQPVTVTSLIARDEFVVSVHNAGEPIPAALLPTLFEPLVRGTDSGAETHSVGLGLYIVAEIVRAHGGRVAVQSTHADGTTFTATLPHA